MPENPKPRYLSKSRFKLALECVTKLYYTGKKAEYADQNLDDPFLKALADGGFQVGELAKFLFCDDPVEQRITIDTLDYDEALERTERMLAQQGKVVIAEAAFRFKNLFIRVDLLVKEGNKIDLYEVKAKSINGKEWDGDGDSKKSGNSMFLSFAGTNTEKVHSDWISYLYDLAFQKHVVMHAMPEFQVHAHLILVDKTAVAGIEGLNQKFKIFRNGQKTKVVISDGLKAGELGPSVLKKIQLDDIVEKIINTYPVPTDYRPGIKFKDFVAICEEHYTKDIRLSAPLGSKCKDCQFVKSTDDSPALRSGLMECWKEQSKLSDSDLEKPLVIELWGGKAGGQSLVDKLLSQEVYLLKNVKQEQITPKTIKQDRAKGLTALERRMEQVNRVRENTEQSFFDREGLNEEMDLWEWPLHMIDFETSMVALPFYKGSEPYQGTAFQFSHHILHEDYTVEHYNQFLHFEQGVFPNLLFIRALRDSLTSVPKGDIFRYHNHENTYLRLIHQQISDGLFQIDEEERTGLLEFIDSITITKAKSKKEADRIGHRNMIDLYDLVLRFYCPPYARGVNSLKKILPSIIRDSAYLRDKYSQNGKYGVGLSMPSLNFEDHIWIQADKNNDPYKTLPPVFEQFDRETLDNLVKDFDGVADGGAALTAYNYLQFTSVSDAEREAIRKALLRYCELDTLAMVMLVEGWREMCGYR